MTRPTKVFGLGLNRTGTATLRRALLELGYRPYSFDRTVVDAWLTGDWPALLDAAEAHDVLSDFPWPLIAERLLDHYGERARYVLTTRDTPERWLASQKSHALEHGPAVRVNRKVFGWAYPHGAEEAYRAVYEAHNARIRALFADCPEIFAEICWEAGDGWEKLCGLIGRAVPEAALPHGNASVRRAKDPAKIARNRAAIDRQLVEIAKKKAEHKLGPSPTGR